MIYVGNLKYLAMPKKQVILARPVVILRLHEKPFIAKRGYVKEGEKALIKAKLVLKIPVSESLSLLRKRYFIYVKPII